MMNKTGNINLSIFLEIHNLQLNEKEEEAILLWRETIHKSTLGPVEKSMFTWLLTEQVLRFKNRQLIAEYKEFIFQTVQWIEGNWSEAENHLYLSLSRDVFTVHLAIYYATLMNLKNVGYEPIIQKTATAIRDRVFEKHLKGGMVICSPTHPFASTDLLLTVLPFGLFSPEDLVMVEAVKEIESSLVKQENVYASPLSNEHSELSVGLMAWYFLEKGEHAELEYYLNLMKETDETTLHIKRIIDTYISSKQNDVTITHEPFGNENKYEPQVFERFPRVPVEGEEVNVQFTAPFSSEASANVYVKTSSETMVKTANYINGKKPYWKANIGSYSAHEEVVYYIEWKENEKTITSPPYTFYPLEKIDIRGVSGQQVSDQKFEFWPEHAHSPLSLTIDLGQKSIQILKKNCSNHKDNKLKVNDILAEQGLPKLYEDHYIAPITLLVDRFGNWVDLSIRFYSPLQERFFGMGERYHQLEYRGEELDCYVYNQYRDQGARTYMPIPFYISSLGYGLHVDTSKYTRFDFAKEFDDLLSISISQHPQGEASIQFYKGTPLEIVSDFTKQTGPADMLPTWAFGPWMSSNNWDRDEVVRAQVDITTELEIPSTVLVLEQWSDETTYYIFNDAIYEPTDGSYALSYEDFTYPEWGRWPNPKMLVEYINEHGMELILWQIPIMKYLNRQHHPQKDNDEAYMIDQLYYIKDKHGKPYRIPEGWFKESLLMDFSNLQGAKWWFEKRKYLLDIGVAGFKTDGGEMVFGEDIQFADMRLGSEMRNEYPNDYIKAYYDFAQEYRPNNTMTFSRAGYTGAQKFPAHWAGDERSTFAAFKRSLIAGLSSGLSGVIMWGWDLAGFNGDIPTAELFIRSAQMAAFCPIMQYHAESKAEFNQDRTPWNVAKRTKDDRAINGYRFFANVRMNLLPYIVEQARLATSKGIPLMRAMVLECPSDPKTYSLYDQYFFGDNLLVAPIIEERAERRKVYLPSNKWVNLFNKEVFQGSQFIEVDAPLMEIPVFQKNNSCIITNLSETNPKLGSYVGNSVTLYNYPALHISADQSFSYEGIDHLNEKWVVNVSLLDDSTVLISIDSCHDKLSIVYTNTFENNISLQISERSEQIEVASGETVFIEIE
ncbi:glycoside hydrolase family 31 protein [Bacillus sp. HMF5848]|uniref:glycoside hydrolase family 31 protein n=1 Tax=Bacillus sp. HMF5848 TaxID=2495421 RepID=UPI000F7A7BA3|nr:TIM-barrel domain-containing protein [Bacillus sp. HMF5848]RSK28296.1 glycoside hydrolase family 31 protein [Bacillus sp. HMF5848]